MQILQWFGSFVSQVLSTRERRALLVLLALVSVGYLIAGLRRHAEPPLPGNLDSLRVAFQLQAALVRGSEWKAEGTADNGPVDLNQANANELCRLPGVGPARARAILELRTKLGRFENPSELLQVRGIGPATLERLRSMVVAGPPPGADTLMAHQRLETE